MNPYFYSPNRIFYKSILCVLLVLSFSLIFLVFNKEVVARESHSSFEQRISSLMNQNKLHEAMTETDKYLNKYKKDNYCVSWGYNTKGTIFSKKGEYTKAIYAYQESLKKLKLLKSDDETKDNMRILLTHIGYLQQALGDYTEAISYYEESVRIMDNNDPRRYMPIMDVAWSKFYLSQGIDTTVLQQVYEETKPMLRRVEYLLNEYEKGYAYYTASKIAFQIGRFDEAVQLLKTELNLIENNLTADNADDVRLGLAITLLYLKKKDEANDVFRKIRWVTASKDSIALWYWLKGDTVLARRYLEKHFVEECPNETARENLRRIIRNNEILTYDMWRDARKKKWFRDLIYTNTLEYANEQHAEKPENETQDGIETYTNENQEKDSSDTGGNRARP